MSIDTRARDASAAMRRDLQSVTIPDPAAIIEKDRRKRSRNRVGVITGAVVVVLALAISVVLRSATNQVSVNAQATSTAPGSIDTRYVPPTQTTNGATIVPVTLPDGRTFEFRYSSRLELAQLGFMPAATIAWPVGPAPTQCCGRDLSIRYTTIRSVLPTALPAATYPGSDGRTVPYYQNAEAAPGGAVASDPVVDGLYFQFGPWLVVVPDRSDPVNHPDERMTEDQRATWARDLSGHVDSKGFLELTARAPLMLTHDNLKAAFAFGDIFDTNNQVVLGDHALRQGPGTDTATPRRFTPTQPDAGASWCDPVSGLHVTVAGTKQFVETAIRDLHIRQIRHAH